VLRRIFGPKRKEVIGAGRKLHNEELNDVLLAHYCAGDKIEKNEMGGACSSYGGGERGVQGVRVKTLGTETTGETQV
jgi:hypothetical protein